MRRFDYVRYCVEQRTGRLGDRVYSVAVDLSSSKNCKSMQDRIDAIVASVPAARKEVLHAE